MRPLSLLNNRLFKSIRGAALDFATILGGVAGAIAAFAVTSPDTVANYLDSVTRHMASVDGNVAIIAQTVPLWPLVDNVSTEFEPPTAASINVDISNPKNILILNFTSQAYFTVESKSYSFDLDSPNIIPPNNAISARRNVIREAWFMEVLNFGSVPLTICFSGELEGSDEVFNERRVYLVNFKESSAQLMKRDFGLGEVFKC